ncbi:MAG: galactokinase [Candidatus Aphodocola sp.]
MDNYNEEFKNIYGCDSEDKTFCPYRVCPCGAHSDHQYGHVTGFAIDKGIHILYKVNDESKVIVTSKNFEGTETFEFEDLEKEDDWADYVRGTTKILFEEFKIKKGITAYIIGTMPIGGLSSSAAVIIAFLNAMCKANNIKLTKDQVIKLALKVEQDFIGINVGTLDQSCEMFCKKDNLLYLDTKDGSYELIPKNPNMPEYKICVLFSGVQRTLVGSAFNMRVDELKSAAYALMAYADMPYGKFKDARLRTVPYQVFIEHKDKLPINWMKRAMHYYTEMDRVDKMKAAWKKGDIVEIGKLMSESGESSIYNYETGSDELKSIGEICKNIKGIYGGRFSGAGFKGCYVALVNPKYMNSIEKEVTEKYLNKFPQYKGKFKVYFCDTADGCEL